MYRVLASGRGSSSRFCNILMYRPKFWAIIPKHVTAHSLTIKLLLEMNEGPLCLLLLTVVFVASWQLPR